ncbi:hypothetical protein LTR84_002418 [Exophiala bonariae]|uniref:Zn(2)-C6 fungal-type domain-containing protein n=1 Tax=Exophiala bonariae TaxID=1690606 RepID=A0AAV9N9K9_9EURO|nr:hypothetical protein LTR84_002418 [Exophiala bonariae]
MSQPLAPRPSQGGASSPTHQSSQKPRKISTACGACKQRKTRVALPNRPISIHQADHLQCTGGNPCEACATRRSPCVYDASSDQRRKIANQRNVQDLAETQLDLERHRQLLGGIIATIRVGDDEANRDLYRVIRSGVDLSQIAAHVRNECRANIEIQQAYDEINFVIDGPRGLPSPTQLLSEIPSREDTFAPASLESESSEASGSMFLVDKQPNA